MRSWSSSSTCSRSSRISSRSVGERRRARDAVLAAAEAQLEQAHELLRDARVGCDHVVLERLRVARSDALAVAPVRAQDLDLRPAQLGRHDEPVERVGLRLAVPDRAQRLRHPLAGALQVQRRVAGTEHGERLHPQLGLAVQARRELLDHAQAEVLQQRRRAAQLDLRAALVQRHAGAPAVVVGQPDDEVAPPVASRSRQATSAAPSAGRSEALYCSGSRRPQRAASIPPRSLPSCATSSSRRRSSHVRASSRTSDCSSLVETCWRPSGGVGDQVHLHPVALAQHLVDVDPVGAVALGDQLAHGLADLGAGRSRGTAAISDTVRPSSDRRVSSRDSSARSSSSAATAPWSSAAARGEQLVLGKRVEERDGCLVVVRALDQVEAREDLVELGVEQRRRARGLRVGAAREEADHAPGAAEGDRVHAHAAVDRRELRDLADRQALTGGHVAAREPEVRPAAHDSQEHEVAVEQPAQERGLVGRGRLVGEHLHARGHRREVRDDPLHAGEHLAHRVLELGQLGCVQPAGDLEVHDRFAGQLARVADTRDVAGRVALDADDRMRVAHDLEAARQQLGPHRIDEERQVARVGLEQRAAGARRGGAHGGRRLAAAAGELVRGADLLGEVGVRRLGIGDPASQVGLAEGDEGVALELRQDA